MVTGDDLDRAFHDAEEAGSPDAVIERIQAAVDDPALRGDDFTAGYALAMISDLQMRYDRPADAEATLRTAVDNDVRDDDLFHPRASLAALLVDLGRPDDAAAEFARLKSSGTASGNAYLIYGEALETSGDFRGAINVYAAGELVAERSGDPSLAKMLHRSADRARNDGVPSVPRVAVPALAAGADPLDFDDVADDLADDFALDEEVGPALAVAHFWPRPDHERVLDAWPALADELGRDWDEHRARLERLLAHGTEAGEVGVLAVADFASFAAHAGERGAPALDGYLRRHAETADLMRWPPERNAPCWCGSGQKYKRCCRPRSFT